jgi:hypothetical protein
MVCEKNLLWERFDSSGCPWDTVKPLDGAGCIGGKEWCYSPSGWPYYCDHNSWQYRPGAIDF